MIEPVSVALDTRLTDRGSPTQSRKGINIFVRRWYAG